MKQNYELLIDLIKRHFSKGEECLYLSLNLFTKKWTACNENFGSVAGLSTEFVINLNEKLLFILNTIDKDFINIKCDLFAFELMEHLENQL